MHIARFDRLKSGPVELDLTMRQLRLDGSQVPLSALPLRLLEQLMRADGRVVTRSELKRELWPYAERIDVERRLNTVMRVLREALDDTAAEPKFIVTVRGHGYRWIAQSKRRAIPSHWQIAAALTVTLLAVGPSGPTFRRGASIAPANFRYDISSRRRLAWNYVNHGQLEAALPHVAALIQAGGDAGDRADLGWLLLRSGAPAAALAACSDSPTSTLNLLSCRQTALARLGLIENAREVGLQIMQAAHADPALVRHVADAPTHLGYSRFLRWRVDAFVRPGRDWFQRAQLQAEAGMYGAALASLRQAAALRDPLLVKIDSSAEFVPLRGSRTFRRIAKATATLS